MRAERITKQAYETNKYAASGKLEAVFCAAFFTVLFEAHNAINAESRRAFARRLVERIMGVEPTTSAWEANVLPINYIRIT